MSAVGWVICTRRTAGLQGTTHMAIAGTSFGVSSVTLTPSAMRFGADQLCRDLAPLGGARRIGLITNDAARLATDAARPARVALRNAGVPLVRLFSPEHGLGANAPDGQAVRDAHDVRTDLPVISLYGDQLRPTREQLCDLDAVLFDIPDVGARFYTYTWTLWHALAACADADVPLIVLDRPNPLGGDLARAEGPMLDAAHRSFLGEDTIPIVHACTLGELVRLWQAERCPSARVSVVPMLGWSRANEWPALGLPWIPTSPAMPSFDSARWYAGLCLFEATNLSVGRGTPFPFTCVGAPWLRVDAVCDAFYRRIGAPLRAVHFTPSTDRYAGERCVGVRVDELGRDAIRPVALGLHLLASIAETHPSLFGWHAYPTAANPAGTEHLVRLLGQEEPVNALAAPADMTHEDVRRFTRTDEWAERLRAADALLYV